MVVVVEILENESVKGYTNRLLLGTNDKMLTSCIQGSTAANLSCKVGHLHSVQAYFPTYSWGWEEATLAKEVVLTAVCKV